MSTQTEGRGISKSHMIAGTLAGLAACLIGAGWQIATRQGVTTSLSPIDLSLFRYGIPALILAPIWIKGGLLPRNIPPLLVFLMVAGAGLPFGLMVMAGSQYAPVAHLAALLPGAMPLCVALLARLFLSEKPKNAQIAGLLLIMAGISLISHTSLSDFAVGTWRGDALFLAAAFSWAVYVIAFRKSGLSPWQGAALVNGWSLFLVIPAWVSLQTGALFEASAEDILIQTLWQGLFAGLLGLWIYGYSLIRIGAIRSAAIGALVPVFSGLGGWLFLQESIPPLILAGIGAVTIGVSLSAGLLQLLRPAGQTGPGSQSDRT